SYASHPAPHSFPTRRSSDLLLARASESRRAVRAAATAFEAYLWTLPLTVAGKKLFARERPTGDADARGFFSGGSIFPSGHSARRSEEHTSELQSRFDLVCRL